MQTYGIIAFALAALASAGLMPLVIRMAEGAGLVDLPGPRKVHHRPVPRVGGIAIALGTLIGAAVLFLPAVHRLVGPLQGQELLVCAFASLLILLLGVADDVFNLPAKLKLLGLFGAAAILCAGGVRIDEFSLEGTRTWHAGWLAWPITMLWVVGIVVSINFIDGLDGLAGGVCLIAAATLAIVAAHHDRFAVTLAALALAGALGGFLVHNWHPARVFMGDGGSMFLGFALASLTVTGAKGHGTFSGLIVPALPLTLAIIDTALTLIRRHILQRRSLFAAEQGHLHHRLIQIGLSQPHTVAIFYGVSIIGGASGLMMLFGTTWLKALGVVAVVSMVVGVLRLAESAGLLETLRALRHNRHLLRESKRLRRIFEDHQLHFRNVRDFEGWWREVCKAAESFEFLQVRLPLTSREGKQAVRKWCATDGHFDDAELLAASVPVRQRRSNSSLKLEVHLGPSEFLESASERLTLFSRLMDEHSVATLPSTRQFNPTYQPGPVMPIYGATPHASGGAAAIAAIKGETIYRDMPSTVASSDERSTVLPPLATDARIAIVHDFLYTYAGAERVLEQMLELYPNADVFSLFDFVPEKSRGFLKGKQVKTSFIQQLPFARRAHRAFLPLMPLAVEQLDVSGYDIVISSSYVAAKGVITRPDQLHVCYCHTPVRFAWDLQNQYLKTVGLGFGLKAILSRIILHYIRTWDVRSANGVDAFVTNSDFVGRRIAKFYRRQATTIYPPVAVEKFPLQTEKQDFYLTASRLVPYKRIDAIVEAFSLTPQRRLIVVGEGPEMERIKAKAGPNVSLVGYQPDDALRRYMQFARAFVFAAEEDFGIVIVEAQACGTPVIACGRGGVTENVVDGKTGVFFHEQTAEAIAAAVDRFETLSLDPTEIHEHAQRFSSERFRDSLGAHVQSAWDRHRGYHGGDRTTDGPGTAEKEPGVAVA